MIALGIIGLLAISIAIWIKIESNQNILFVLGGASLFIYSIHIGDTIFTTLQAVFIISTLVELYKKK